jgi:microsomal dipeptidase-like Zn-dependent dipeptidase
MRRLVVLLAAFSLVLVAAVLVVDPVDGLLNRATQKPHPVSSEARALHDSLWIADFHNDALLWNRNLLDVNERGLLDLPRLRRGGFELAVFSATTRMHIDSNYHRTLPVLDVLPAVAIASHWPRRAWFDPFERALVLSGKLHAAANASRGRLRVVESKEDMRTLVQAQSAGDSVVGGVLLLEGLHAIDGDIARVDSLFAAGYRVFGIVHMFDNELGGSSGGWRKGGLTPLGKRVVVRIDSLGGIVDLAHASNATIDDVLSITTQPVVVSHTGLISNCPGPRNLSDDAVRRIAARGGLVGIGFWKHAVCGKDPAAVARAIKHAIKVAGVLHVALGSDFDGGTWIPFDTAHIDMLTAALLNEGLSPDDIRHVMGENEKRFLSENLPPH